MRCPFCKKVIEILQSEATATTNAIITEEGAIVFDAEDDSDIWETNEWRCPECEEIIAYNQEQAIKFVKGGILIK